MHGTVDQIHNMGLSDTPHTHTHTHLNIPRRPRRPDCQIARPTTHETLGTPPPRTHTHTTFPVTPIDLCQIHNGWDSRDEALIVALNHVVLYVSDRGFVVPAPVRASGGSLVSTEMLPVASTAGAAGGGGEEKSEM